jgi:translation elongation factor EF-G
MPGDIHTPPLLVQMAIEPKSKADQERLGNVLAKLTAEDVSFRVSIDHESHQTILKGLNEGHLEGKADILTRNGIEVRIGAPQVAFLERPTRRAEAEYTHDKPIGSMRQFSSVKLAVEPREAVKGYLFVSNVAEDAMIVSERIEAAVTIDAIVPLMSLFGYGSALHAMSRGCAAFTMQFDCYAPAPPMPKDDPPFQPAIGMRA